MKWVKQYRNRSGFSNVSTSYLFTYIYHFSTVMNKDGVCSFCGVGAEREEQLGTLHNIADLYAHYFCLVRNSVLQFFHFVCFQQMLLNLGVLMGCLWSRLWL